VQPVSWSRDQINQPPNSPVSRSNSCWTERGESRKLVLREQLGLGFRVLVRFMPEKVFVLFLLWAHTYRGFSMVFAIADGLVLRLHLIFVSLADARSSHKL
jgi:hypothetical protein